MCSKRWSFGFQIPNVIRNCESIVYFNRETFELISSLSLQINRCIITIILAYIWFRGYFSSLYISTIIFPRHCLAEYRSLYLYGYLHIQRIWLVLLDIIWILQKMYHPPMIYVYNNKRKSMSRIDTERLYVLYARTYYIAVYRQSYPINCHFICVA